MDDLQIYQSSRFFFADFVEFVCIWNPRGLKLYIWMISAWWNHSLQYCLGGGWGLRILRKFGNSASPYINCSPSYNMIIELAHAPKFICRFITINIANTMLTLCVLMQVEKCGKIEWNRGLTEGWRLWKPLFFEYCFPSCYRQLLKSSLRLFFKLFKKLSYSFIRFSLSNENAKQQKAEGL